MLEVLGHQEPGELGREPGETVLGDRRKPSCPVNGYLMSKAFRRGKKTTKHFCCGGLTLAGCQMPTKLLHHSAPQQDIGGENKMKKNPNMWVKVKAV